MSRKLRHRSHHGQNAEAPQDPHQELEQLAYRYWEERGRPFGSPEEDWYKAVAEMEKDEEAASRL